MLVLCLLFLGLGASPAHSVNSVRRAIEARYHHAKTLKAIFFERYSDGSGGIAAASGTVYFSHPGRMRWEYESPEKKLFLVDGKHVWFYVPADHTVSKATVKTSSDWRTPLALLAGKADLDEVCRKLEIVTPSHNGPKGSTNIHVAPGDTLLRCLPKGESRNREGPIRNVLLEVDPQSWLVRVIIHQEGNAETEFRFGNWQENIPIPEVKFHFVPPPGVSVVDEEALANEIH